ncbi:MAG: hypothetical protein EXS25_09325 [Pedosphaera sp.]|nr:hypothetical protein [Pedosphaera sp.]
MNGPKGIAAGSNGQIHLADTENHAIRRINPKSGTIETVVGGAPLDNRPTSLVKTGLNRPHGILVDRDGTLYIGDSENHRIQMLRPQCQPHSSHSCRGNSDCRRFDHPSKSSKNRFSVRKVESGTNNEITRRLWGVHWHYECAPAQPTVHPRSFPSFSPRDNPSDPGDGIRLSKSAGSNALPRFCLAR